MFLLMETVENGGIGYMTGNALIAYQVPRTAQPTTQGHVLPAQLAQQGVIAAPPAQQQQIQYAPAALGGPLTARPTTQPHAHRAQSVQLESTGVLPALLHPTQSAPCVQLVSTQWEAL